MKATCVQLNEQINHRFYKFDTWKEESTTANCKKIDIDRPLRQPKSLQIFYGDFNHPNSDRRFNLEQKQFKNIQTLKKQKAILTTKYKQ